MKKTIFITVLIFLSASCNFFSKSSPVGIIKTVNGGTDWQFSNSVKGNTASSISGLNISKIDLDPQNRQTVFAGAYNGGLFKSEDSGASWTNIFPNKIFVYDFVINPNDSKTIYAVGFYNGAGRVAKTTDGGASWNEIYHEAAQNNAVRTIALNPVNLNQVLIGTVAGTVIKSSDAGGTWQLVKDFKSQVNRIAWQNNQIYVLLKSQGIQMSADNGANFSNITTSLGGGNSVYGYVYNSATTISSYNQTYIDNLDPNLMYLTTDLGLYKTMDGGKNWNKISLPVKSDQTQTQAHALAVSKTTSSIVYTSINSTVYKSQDAGSTWQTEGVSGAGGYINYLLVDPQLPQIVYGGIYATPQ